jgi:hypothetical protein
MTDTPNREWDDWQAAWRTEVAPAPLATTVAPPAVPRVVEMHRRLLRNRRLGWAHTALDICAAKVFWGIGAFALIKNPTLPVFVWAISLFVFTVIAFAWTIWNRRDALMASAQSTADFIAALRMRLERRERVPRFIMRLAAAEIAFGAVFYAIWSPDSIGRVAKGYGAVALGLVVWWRWHRKRLGRERAQLEALCREPELTDAAGS